MGSELVKALSKHVGEIDPWCLWQYNSVKMSFLRMRCFSVNRLKLPLLQNNDNNETNEMEATVKS